MDKETLMFYIAIIIIAVLVKITIAAFILKREMRNKNKTIYIISSVLFWINIVVLAPALLVIVVFLFPTILLGGLVTLLILWVKKNPEKFHDWAVRQSYDYSNGNYSSNTMTTNTTSSYSESENSSKSNDGLWSNYGSSGTTTIDGDRAYKSDGTVGYVRGDYIHFNDGTTGHIVDLGSSKIVEDL